MSYKKKRYKTDFGTRILLADLINDLRWGEILIFVINLMNTTRKKYYLNRTPNHSLVYNRNDIFSNTLPLNLKFSKNSLINVITSILVFHMLKRKMIMTFLFPSAYYGSQLNKTLLIWEKPSDNVKFFFFLLNGLFYRVWFV